MFRDEQLTAELVARARDAGFTALVLTVDTPVLARRERDHRTGFTIPPEIAVASLGQGGVTPAEAFAQVSPSVSWRDVERLASDSGLPVVVKGVLTAEDARLACEHGAAGLVVSNHGGRQLDGVSATIDALPEVVDAVDGRIEVLLDGGVRRGTRRGEGARARRSRRPRRTRAALGAGGRRRGGARAVLDLLRDEILVALKLVGCSSPADVTRERVQPQASRLP